ncbi:MAG: sugar ABC transporter permease [Lachnospiraceae bacterium]|nr:sugar ABC transporter permease [Lachnospiraceae bacterium]
MSKSKKKGMSMRQRRTLEGLMFISPWIVGALLFFVYPIIVSIRLSMSELTSMNGMEMSWVGLKNFKDLVSNDTVYITNFLESIKNTVINTPITLVFSLLIAIMINRDIKGRGAFRTIFFIPVLLGTGYVMDILVNNGASNVVSGGADSALITMIMKSVGSTFGTYVQTFLSTITTVLWKSGVQIILFLAGLQSIPGSLYEASRCDGATEWENFWKITLPIVSPIILLNFIYTMIDSFTDASNPIIADIEHQFQNKGALDVGAAMGWMYFLFTFIVCGIVLAVMNKLTFNIGER